MSAVWRSILVNYPSLPLRRKLTPSIVLAPWLYFIVHQGKSNSAYPTSSRTALRTPNTMPSAKSVINVGACVGTGRIVSEQIGLQASKS